MEYRKEGTTTTGDATIKSELSRVLASISEAPSPRLIVNTARAIVAGQDVSDAVREGIFNAITNDFGPTANALATMARNTYNIQ